MGSLQWIRVRHGVQVESGQCCLSYCWWYGKPIRSHFTEVDNSWTSYENLAEISRESTDKIRLQHLHFQWWTQTISAVLKKYHQKSTKWQNFLDIFSWQSVCAFIHQSKLLVHSCSQNFWKGRASVQMVKNKFTQCIMNHCRSRIKLLEGQGHFPGKIGNLRIFWDWRKIYLNPWKIWLLLPAAWHEIAGQQDKWVGHEGNWSTEIKKRHKFTSWLNWVSAATL